MLPLVGQGAPLQGSSFDKVFWGVDVWNGQFWQFIGGKPIQKFEPARSREACTFFRSIGLASYQWVREVVSTTWSYGVPIGPSVYRGPPKQVWQMSLLCWPLNPARSLIYTSVNV